VRVSARELYGLRAMSEFARCFGQGPLSLSEVAKVQGISQAYLEQIAIDLRRAGLLHSRRGAQGGYYLARAPEATTAGDVIRALEDGCSTRGIWEEVRDRLVETLDSITLADLE
jgi:Rrf2 family cysteine metabolism transcriptional repressor